MINNNNTTILNYTVFFTYMLSNSGNASDYGYSDAIHCNYINSIQLNDVINKEVNLSFNNINDFKFLTTGSTVGTGYTANKIYIIAQMINNNTSDLKPISTNWKIVDVTDQVRYRMVGSHAPLSALDLTTNIFKISLIKLNAAPFYNLDYLNYPLINASGSTMLSFGDEIQFLGNVTTDIEAIAYTTDMALYLPLEQFNSSTNATWNNSTVYISEVGIYDSDYNLVAIGKLNDPIPKDNKIARTIVFAIDF